MRFGILTSGGDSPGLNAAIRGVTKTLYRRMPDAEMVGIIGGYTGLLEKQYREMKPEDFYGIMNLGGTILRTTRQPFKSMRDEEEPGLAKIDKIVANARELGLDCVIALGGNGTHKTANLLAQHGLKVVALPKTIDNDIWGTDETFGFHTATELGVEVVDRIYTTAASHSRVIVVEIMGNKFGWLALAVGLGSGAEVIVLPEIPYNIDKISETIFRRAERGRSYSVVIVAEGAYSVAEAGIKAKERVARRQSLGFSAVSAKLAKEIQEATGIESRAMVPGHYLRGGAPSAYDRILTTQFGTYAANLICEGSFGTTVAKKDGKITHNPLAEVAGKTKPIPPDHPFIQAARSTGVSFAD
ncbi:MAG: ATP-dependent 6-phosphofructokinase [Oscillospiraceae bacterium]|nr:ATP-dependent 6-phosphofructokinase [Oscillospiraceae bacterium]